MTDHADERELARETKAIVALAFRNGPIEDVHAGQLCPTCTGKPGYSRVSDAEMKLIVKNAVNRVYVLLWLKVARTVTRERSLSANTARRNGTPDHRKSTTFCPYK